MCKRDTVFFITQSIFSFLKKYISYEDVGVHWCTPDTKFSS